MPKPSLSRHLLHQPSHGQHAVLDLLDASSLEPNATLQLANVRRVKILMTEELVTGNVTTLGRQPLCHEK
jgi:hypothetical protein